VLTALFREVPNLYEAIVVDDGSKDNTAQIVEEFCQEIPRVRLIRQPSNQGKTAALRAGFAASTGEIVIVQDADLEYDPVDIPGLIEPIENGKADVVFGSRFLTRRASRILYFRHYMANQFLTFLSNLFTDLNFTDVETGYKAFRGRDHPQYDHRNARVRLRNRSYGQGCQAKVPRVRSTHLILWAHLRGRQENWLQRWPGGYLLHL
jgi:glycosyltransferase involved in cell wall biosynthesis